METKQITSDGAAVDVQLGYTPNRVEVYNQTSNVTLVWTDDLTDGYARKIAADGTATLEITKGITPFAADPDAASIAAIKGQGFNLGVMVDVNDTNAEVLDVSIWRDSLVGGA